MTQEAKSMVEVVARALCHCDEQDGGGPWDYHTAKYQDGYRDRARAAIAAMERASPAMCEAFYDLTRKHDTLAIAASEAWSAMIQAALSEDQVSG